MWGSFELRQGVKGLSWSRKPPKTASQILNRERLQHIDINTWVKAAILSLQRLSFFKKTYRYSYEDKGFSLSTSLNFVPPRSFPILTDFYTQLPQGFCTTQLAFWEPPSFLKALSFHNLTSFHIFILKRLQYCPKKGGGGQPPWPWP